MSRRLRAALHGAVVRLRGQGTARRRAAPRFEASLALRDPLPRGVREFGLGPIPSGECSGYWLDLRGRFRPREGTGRAVLVTDGISTLSTFPVDAHGYFQGTVNTADLGPAARLTLLGESGSQPRRVLGDLVLEIEQPDRAGEGFLQPLAVLSTGRSGTTAVMQLLAALPEVAVRDSYPWECRFGQYQAHAFAVLTQTASPRPEDGIGRFHRSTGHLARNPQALPADPAYGWYSADYVDVLRRTTTATIEAFYRTAPDIDAGRARYFAEKVTPQMFTTRAYRSLYRAPRILFLVRDPRDTMASVLAFNRKRGTDEFGWQPDDTPERYARRFVNNFRLLNRIWRHLGDQALLVRYEDLMQRPEAEIARLGAALDVSVEDPAALADLVLDRSDRMRHHRTAPRAEASLGRWRRELSPEVLAVFRERTHGFLETFDYPLA